MSLTSNSLDQAVPQNNDRRAIEYEFKITGKTGSIITVTRLKFNLNLDDNKNGPKKLQSEAQDSMYQTYVSRPEVARSQDYSDASIRRKLSLQACNSI